MYLACLYSTMLKIKVSDIVKMQFYNKMSHFDVGLIRNRIERNDYWR